MRDKIFPFDELVVLLAAARQGKAVVLCHGCFDFLHIGHIKHLQRAKRMGDILVVTVTPDYFVGKGPGRPVFPHGQRAEAIAALECVDYVAINKWPIALNTIHQLRPNYFAKGAEFRDNLNLALCQEKEAAEAMKGVLVFTDEPVTFSTTELLRRLRE